MAANKLKDFFDKPLGRIVALIGAAIVIVIGGVTYQHFQGNSNNGAAAMSYTAGSNTGASSTSTEANTSATTPSPKPTTKQLVNSWYKSYDYLVTDLQSDFTQAQTDAQNNDMSGLSDDCSSIVSDSSLAQGKPAIPDASIQTNWSTALSDESAGGNACEQAITNNDTSELNQATTDFNNGSTALSAATNAIKALQ